MQTDFTLMDDDDDNENVNPSEAVNQFQIPCAPIHYPLHLIPNVPLILVTPHRDTKITRYPLRMFPLSFCNTFYPSTLRMNYLYVLESITFIAFKVRLCGTVYRIAPFPRNSFHR